MAAGGAPFQALVMLSPKQRQGIDQKLQQFLQDVGASVNDSDFQHGVTVGYKVFRSRANDGSRQKSATANGFYHEKNTPGEWRRDPLDRSEGQNPSVNSRLGMCTPLFV